jgi:hypothetical protein
MQKRRQTPIVVLNVDDFYGVFQLDGRSKYPPDQILPSFVEGMRDAVKWFRERDLV